ncbi:hypothetical protein [Streptomyces bluensis]|uniref:hypothetical protein n=1 Tax=Streptomyces bluensis TaxID=33897 RepID=UPI00198B729D|nr:hypothetical protein [Streptomyces bluensis]GGZ52548.1 hypothetical protein GCM10010344_18260 [Streptomyces bluensis]
MNIQPLLDALDLQTDAARALAEDLRTQIDGLQTRLREAEMHLKHLAITRKTITGLADRLPAHTPDLPEHPDYPRILAIFNRATGPLRAKDVSGALGHELLPKNVEGTHAKLKRLVKLGILTEADTGNSPGSHRRRNPTSAPAPTSARNRHRPTNRPLRRGPVGQAPFRGPGAGDSALDRLEAYAPGDLRNLYERMDREVTRGLGSFGAVDALDFLWSRRDCCCVALPRRVRGRGVRCRDTTG